ncbi:hypothetical protein L1987_06949 [Smallanthus sonchifolius]|uniref:Uncharacterized protein n=1 Tax=Smallanthus sonchifolius TaxID=185202 RepID=A0ACB9JZQ3_9ASTR|nr:hypothetical protein L1987_06949 [Smallanthus sonchifolius]
MRDDTNSVQSDERVMLEPVVRDSIDEEVYHVIRSTMPEIMAEAIKAVADEEKAKEKSDVRGFKDMGKRVETVYVSGEEEEENMVELNGRLYEERDEALPFEPKRKWENSKSQNSSGSGKTTDVRTGMKAKARAFQISKKEAKEQPDVVSGVSLLLLFLPCWAKPPFL